MDTAEVQFDKFSVLIEPSSYEKLLASLDIVGEGRELDDNAQVLVTYDNGASGVYWTSQVAAGYDNSLRVRVFGSAGSVEFDQEDSNHL